jgi:prophage regulatory protein
MIVRKKGKCPSPPAGDVPTTHAQLVFKGSLARQPLEVVQIEDAMLELRTVTAVTGRGKSSIYAMVARGEFPAPVRYGKRCSRWQAGAVTRWLKKQARGAK